MTFAQFTAHGAHGVAGVTVQTEPPLSPPIYFNKDVVPDAKRSESSRDGGVLWTNVANGTYRVSATHPTQKFSTFLITCAPGRVVNANPPWGLHEL